MTNQLRDNIIEEFIQFCKLKLDINNLPNIIFVNDREWAANKRSFGEYDPSTKQLHVYIGNRNLADILRTLCHELVHHRQLELNMLKPGSGETGSEIENQANSFAGILMREYGKMNDLIYESILPSLKQIYEVEKSSGIQIYCDMDGVLCDFDERFEHFYNMSPLQYKKKYTPAKANEYLTQAVNEVGIQFWSKMNWIPGGIELWEIIGKYNPIILTSPGNFDYAEKGKLEWISNNLNPQPKEVIFAQSGNKHLKMVTNPKNSMLIDDFWPNLAPWKASGGIAIMHKDINKTKSILDKFRIKESIHKSENLLFTPKEKSIEKDEHGELLSVEYSFNTGNSDYKVIFDSFEKPRIFKLTFGKNKAYDSALDTDEMTGEGMAMKILKAVSETVNMFYEKYKNQIDKIEIKGTSEKRTRVYKLILPKFIKPEVLNYISIK